MLHNTLLHIQYAYCNYIPKSLCPYETFVVKMLNENSNMANEKEENHAEIVRYQCNVHEKDLVPLL